MRCNNAPLRENSSGARPAPIPKIAPFVFNNWKQKQNAILAITTQIFYGGRAVAQHISSVDPSYTSTWHGKPINISANLPV